MEREAFFCRSYASHSVFLRGLLYAASQLFFVMANTMGRDIKLNEVLRAYVLILPRAYKLPHGV